MTLTPSFCKTEVPAVPVVFDPIIVSGIIGVWPYGVNPTGCFRRSLGWGKGIVATWAIQVALGMGLVIYPVSLHVRGVGVCLVVRGVGKPYVFPYVPADAQDYTLQVYPKLSSVCRVMHTITLD